ncbi:MAG: APC family permease [Thermoprotei archaeon]
MSSNNAGEGSEHASGPGLSHSSPDSGLRRGAVGLWHALFQAQSHVAPAADTALLLTGSAAIALGSLPLVIVLAWIGYFLMLNTNYQFSKYLSSAAGYYGFAANGLGKKWGILTGWLFIGNEALAFGAFGYLGAASLIYLLSPSLSGIPYLWIALIAPYALFIFLIEYLGIRPSLNYALITGVIEVAFLAITGAAIVFLAGKNNTLEVFTFKPVGGHFGPVFLAFIIGITTLAGSGSAVAIAEETKQPKRNIPKSLLYVMLINLVVILSAYALTVGWGVNNMSTFASSPDPGIIVYRNYLGPIVALLFAALIYNSYFAFGLAINNSLSRTMYAMARDGIILPRSLAATHPKYKSPHKIIALITGWSLAFALANGLIFGPFNGGVYPFVMIGLMLILTHAINNISLIAYVKRNRLKFSYLLHGLIPLVATVFLALAIYYSFVPFPSAVPDIVYAYLAFAWIVAGIAYSLFMSRKVEKIAAVNVD